jgi:hypothetical protein
MPFAALPAKTFFYSDSFSYSFSGNIINHGTVFITVGLHMAAAGATFRDVVHINNFIGVQRFYFTAAMALMTGPGPAFLIRMLKI